MSFLYYDIQYEQALDGACSISMKLRAEQDNGSVVIEML